MKIREGFIARDVGNKTFVVAVGELSKSFNAIITLNETGKCIWLALEKGATEEEIVQKLLLEFEGAEKEKLEQDVKAFIQKLAENSIIE